MFGRFWENYRFLYSFYPFISRSLHIRFNSLQNISPLCLMVWWWLKIKDGLLAIVSNKEMEDVFGLILHISLIFKIF